MRPLETTNLRLEGALSLDNSASLLCLEIFNFNGAVMDGRLTFFLEPVVVAFSEFLRDVSTVLVVLGATFAIGFLILITGFCSWTTTDGF